MSLIDLPAAGSQRHANNTNTPDRYCIDLSRLDWRVEALSADAALHTKANHICEPLHWVSSFRANWSPGSNKGRYRSVNRQEGLWVNRIAKADEKIMRCFSKTVTANDLGYDGDVVGVSVALVLFPSVEFIQLHCGRNKTSFVLVH